MNGDHIGGSEYEHDVWGQCLHQIADFLEADDFILQILFLLLERTGQKGEALKGKNLCKPLTDFGSAVLGSEEEENRQIVRILLDFEEPR